MKNMKFLNGIKEINQGLENGATYKLLNKINRSDRYFLGKIEKSINSITAENFYKLVNNSELLELINKSCLNDYELDTFLSCDMSDVEKITLLSYSNSNDKIAHFLSLMDEIRNSNAFGKDYYKIILKYIELNLTDEDIKNIIDVVSQYYYNSRSVYGYRHNNCLPSEYYCNIEELRYNNLKSLDSYLMYYINSLFNDLDFTYFKYFNDLNDIFFNKFDRNLSSSDYKNILRTFINAKNQNIENELKKYFKNIFSNDIKLTWFHYLNSKTKSAFNLDEIKKLSYQETYENISLNPIEVLYKNNYVLTQLYEILNSNDPYYNYNDSIYTKIEFVKNNLKKKAFIKLITDNYNTFKTLNSDSVLFNSSFSKVINLNTLNSQNLNKLNYIKRFSKQINTDIPLTFNEFDFLNTCSDLSAKVFYTLLDLPIDKRLRLVKELKNISISSIRELYEDNTILDEVIVDKVSSLVREKSFKNAIKDLSLNIKMVNDQELLLILLEPEKTSKFFNEIRFGSDIRFIMKNYSKIKNFDSLLIAKEALYITDKDYVTMINTLNLSNTFIENNRKSIIDFCDKGLHSVFNVSMKNREFNTTHKNNLMLLTKAELSNKLKDIKFVDEDFFLEIGLEIDQDAKDCWKENMSIKDNEFLYSETYDFDRIIRLGQYPVETCQHWAHGSYSESLLSNFDTNKKMLMATTPNGHNHARSLLRLTKGSFDRIGREQQNNTSLSFKDVSEEESITLSNDQTKKEELVLFVEKLYTSLNYDQELKVRKNFIKLAKKKAEELGARLVISSDYAEVLSDNREFINKKYYVFISYSKNGSQYLDSLSGSVSKNQEGSYNRTTVFMLNEDNDLIED